MKEHSLPGKTEIVPHLGMSGLKRFIIKENDSHGAALLK
jgi:hypothetical protein